MDTVKPSEIVNLYNNGMTLQSIGEKIGKSKSTIQRIIVNNGYIRNNKNGKYEKQENIKSNISEEPIIELNQLNNETNVSRETIIINDMVNRTYAISKEIDRAIRVKAAIEDKKPIDIVREALDNYIEKKYKVLK